MKTVKHSGAFKPFEELGSLLKDRTLPEAGPPVSRKNQTHQTNLRNRASREVEDPPERELGDPRAQVERGHEYVKRLNRFAHTVDDGQATVGLNPEVAYRIRVITRHG